MKPTFEIQILRQCRWETIATETKRGEANKARRQARFFYPVVRIEQIPKPEPKPESLLQESAGK